MLVLRERPTPRFFVVMMMLMLMRVMIRMGLLRFMRMCMFLLMRDLWFFLYIPDPDIHLRRGNTIPHVLLRLEPRSDSERFHRPLKSLKRNSGIHQSADKHVAAD